MGCCRDLNRAFDRSRLDRGLPAVPLAESERTAGKVRARELLQREIPTRQEDEEPGNPGDQPPSCGEVTCRESGGVVIEGAVGTDRVDGVRRGLDRQQHHHEPVPHQHDA